MKNSILYNVKAAAKYSGEADAHEGRARSIPYEYESDNYDAHENRYLGFTVDSRFYALEIGKVNEIVGIQKATKVPDTPDYVKGVINLRGHIIPLIDMRLKFGLTEREYSDRTCVIVVSCEDNTVGLIVDSVEDVTEIYGSMIVDVPEGDRSKPGVGYVKALGKSTNSVRQLLDIEKLLTSI